MDQILEKIQSEEWDYALKLFLERMSNGGVTENDCILGATILEHFKHWEDMYSILCLGLQKNPQNYELYLLLGNYYVARNIDQAYLCYDNALFFAQKNGSEEDVEYIRALINGFTQENDISVRNVSIILLSYNTIEYTKQCIESIRRTCLKESYEIVVVDNASEDGSVQWLREQDDIVLVENKENVGFPAGCNQGIRVATQDNDIFLLNNDTLLMNNSLFMLRLGLYECPENGASGAVSNRVGNNQIVYDNGETIEDYYAFAYYNNIPTSNPYEQKAMLVMFAMLIKREVFEQIGELDELFSPGNFEDNDYGFRILCAGYRNVLCWNSFIYHYGSKSFGKDGNRYIDLILTNKEKFINKWGISGNQHSRVQKGIIKMIEAQEDSPISVLEIGCGMGETLSHIKYKFPNSDVHGIEANQKVAEIAAYKNDIRCGTVESMKMAPEEKYDYIIFTDSLDHVIDPDGVLRRMKNHLKDGGHIIASVPNIMNANIIYSLLHGDFTYNIGGIVDRDRIRFFTRKELIKLFAGAGYEIAYFGSVTKAGETTAAHKEFFEGLLKLTGEEYKADYDTYQYLVSARIVKE